MNHTAQKSETHYIAPVDNPSLASHFYIHRDRTDVNDFKIGKSESTLQHTSSNKLKSRGP